MGSTTIYIVIFTLIIIAILTIIRQQRKSGSSISQILVSVAPLATLATISYQLYTAYRSMVNEKARIDLSLSNDSWLRVRNYLDGNHEKLKRVYKEIHPEEYVLLYPHDNTIDSISTGTTVIPEEIHFVHLIAQSCEDYLISFGKHEITDETWHNIFYKWWQSPTLQRIWPSIKFNYSYETQNVIDSIIKKGKCATHRTSSTSHTVR